MAMARSRVTARSRVSVPADIRRQLGLGPGSFLEWEEKGGDVIVRKAGRHTSVEVHEALFGSTGGPEPAPTADVKEAVRASVRRRHARG